MCVPIGVCARNKINTVIVLICRHKGYGRIDDYCKNNYLQHTMGQIDNRAR